MNEHLQHPLMDERRKMTNVNTYIGHLKLEISELLCAYVDNPCQAKGKEGGKSC